MNKRIPVLQKFEVENLNFKCFRENASDGISIKVSRSIKVKSNKTDKKKFLVDVTIEGMISINGKKELKDLTPNYTIRSFCHFLHDEEIIDSSINNNIIYLSVIQAFSVTSKMFKDRLFDVGISNESIPIGIDFEI